jgi:glycine/sarcosine N-methyltransferase
MPRSARDEQSDPYASFADRYDLFFGEFTYQDSERVDFWSRLLGTGRVHRVLDCACGTGRDLHLLHELGYWACGSDLSAAMLNRARANLAQCGLERPLIQADFRELPYGEAVFDVVICMTTSLPHLVRESEVEQALWEMRRVLREGGMLVLSQGLTDKLLRHKPRFIPEINTPELSRVFAIDYLSGRVRMNVLDLIHEAERHDFIVASFDYQVLLPADYERLLGQVGFGDVAMYGGYIGEPYDPETSDQLVIVARE